MAEDTESSIVYPDASERMRRNRELIRVFTFVGLTVILGSFANAFIVLKLSYLYKKEMGMSADDVTTMQIFLNIPLYLQPFLGAFFDLNPLFGYHRRTYYFVGKLLGAASLFGLALLHTYHYWAVLCLMLFFVSGGAIRTVIFNAIMVALGNRTGRFGQFLSFASLIPIIMSIAYTGKFGGIVAKTWSYPAAFGMAALILLISTPLVLMIDEKRVTGLRLTAETAKEHAERAAAKRAEHERNRAAFGRAARTPALWVMVVFAFYLIITPGTNTVEFYYKTDVLHFDELFMGNLLRYTAWGNLIAYFLFGISSRRWPVFVLVWGAWLMDCLSYPSLMLIHDRTSAIWLAVFGAIIGSLYTICLNTVAARACPPGVEGAVYGLFQSAILLAGVVSEKFGSKLYTYFGPDNKSHHYDLVHAWNWSLYIGLAFTLAGVIFIPFLPAWTRSRDPIGKIIEADMTEPNLASSGDSSSDRDAPDHLTDKEGE